MDEPIHHNGDAEREFDRVFGPPLIRQPEQASRHPGPAPGPRLRHVDKVTTYVAYTAMMLEPPGWRQLIHPLWDPRDACQALADLLREEPLHAATSPADRQEIQEAIGLLEAGEYEVTVLGRRHRIVRVEEVIGIGPDGPEGPRPDDERFVRWPWDTALTPGLARQLSAEETAAIARQRHVT